MKHLSIVGSGIKCISHLTTETIAHIKHADQVLYLVNEPITIEWIQAHSKANEDLSSIYYSHESRLKSYHAISQYILSTLDNVESLCVVMYGHPCIFANPALDAAKQLLDNDSIKCTILPGVSAEDCLFADLKINPGSSGCQSFEATDFLLFKRNFDSRSHLLLWQVSILCELNHPTSSTDISEALNLLEKNLLKHYPKDHSIIIYQAAQYPAAEPIIQIIKLSELSTSILPELATLYIPPIETLTHNADKNVEKLLNLKVTVYDRREKIKIIC